MLIKLKAKVCLKSEDQMEAEETYDLGNVAKSKDWVWRDVGISVTEVYKITAYNASKTMVHLYGEDNPTLLVAEPFEEVYSKWEASLIIYHSYIGVDEPDDDEEEEKETPETPDEEE